MHDFYWLKKTAKESVPHILGLTASPIMGSNLGGLETLESTLDATCKSPRKQKIDLSMYVKPPVMVQIPFNDNGPIATNPDDSRNMSSLIAVYLNLDIHDDPEIIRLRSSNTDASKRKLERALMGKKTFIQNQMKSFVRTSGEIKKCLGTWAADAYVSQVTSSFIHFTDSKDERFLEWEDAERRYLANALRSLESCSHTVPLLPEKDSISDKARILIQFLGSCHESTIGIIFVKERATAHMLRRLIFEHRDTCNRFSLGISVGASQRPVGKRDLFDFSHHDSQSKTLAKFRSGEVNLLIATSVLEEGIDVPQCNLVICFDEPANLKSFVQRRGRARLQESKLVMLLESSSKDRLAEWERLEREMKLLYEMEERAVRKLAKHEELETGHFRRRVFRVPSTGALLDMDSAKGHLECFCSRLSSHSHIQMRPEYIIREQSMEEEYDEPPLLKASVILPVTLDPTLRIHESRSLWRSEKNATKEAAFEAYLALYHAGLVNDHLLPLSFAETSKYMEKKDSIIDVQEQFNPWPGAARAWENKEKIQQRVLTLKNEAGLTKCQMEMLMPVKLPNMKPIRIYWDAFHEWQIEIGLAKTIQHSGLMQDDTRAMLSHSYGHRWQIEQLRHVTLFKATDIEISRLFQGDIPLITQDPMAEPIGLLRDVQDRGHPYLFQKWLSTKPQQQSIQKPDKDYETFPGDQPFVALKRWSIRSDFLHPVQGSATDRGGTEYFKVLPQTRLTMDPLPMAISQFGLLIPSLLHQVQVQLVVAELCATVLSEVEISDLELVRTAISTPVAREQDNYQKLEFLGDSVLKFLVSTFAASKCKQPYHFVFLLISLDKDCVDRGYELT
jgi:ERCC4-related helicase